MESSDTVCKSLFSGFLLTSKMGHYINLNAQK